MAATARDTLLQHCGAYERYAPFPYEAGERPHESDGRFALCDSHCHLQLMANGEDVAREASAMGLALFSMGVLPECHAREEASFAVHPGTHVGLGLHPWYVRADSWRAQLDTFEDRFRDANPHVIGEIGLDFSPARLANADAQRAALERILHLCGERGGLVLSLHAVKSAHEVLDMLQAHGAARTCTCVFHWFSGSSDDLQRALRLGALFSANPRMLETRRGREYARIIPADRILLETDAPAREGGRCRAADISDSLLRTATRIMHIKTAQS